MEGTLRNTGTWPGGKLTYAEFQARLEKKQHGSNNTSNKNSTSSKIVSVLSIPLFRRHLSLTRGTSHRLAKYLRSGEEDEYLRLSSCFLMRDIFIGQRKQVRAS